MDEAYTYHRTRYVLRNPVRAGIVRLPWRYEWSSAAFHIGEKKTDPLVRPNKDLDGMVGEWLARAKLDAMRVRQTRARLRDAARRYAVAVSARYVASSEDWREYLVEPDADEVLCRLRSETSVGRPLGSPAFVQKLEEELDRFLTRRAPGRPRKRGKNQ